MADRLRDNREFSALWVSQAISNLGISVSSFAYPVVVLGATGSAVEAGAVGSVLAATAFALRIPAGAVTDRFPRKRILLASDLGRAVTAAAFATALATGHFWYPQVLAVAFVEAALGVLFGPAEAAAVRRVVGRHHIREAVAANAARASLPGVLGPPLGGVLLAVARSLPFLADAISYLVSFGCVASVRTPLGPDAHERQREDGVGGVFAGIRWVARRRFLRASLLVLMASGFAIGSLGLVILVLARAHGASSRELGLMFAITAAGGGLGGLATPRLVALARPHALMMLFVWVTTAAALSLTVVDQPLLYGASGAFPFFFLPVLNAVVFGMIGEQAPDRLQGRATSAAIQIASFAAPLGPLSAGLAIGKLGAHTAAIVFAGVVGLLACAATLSRDLRGDPDA